MNIKVFQILGLSFEIPVKLSEDRTKHLYVCLTEPRSQPSGVVHSTTSGLFL